MQNQRIIKIVSSITLLGVFLLMPLTSYADMLQELQDFERDTQHLEQRRRQQASDSQLLKFTERNRRPEFRKRSHRQARQEQREGSRPPKTPERILDKFVTRILHSAVMADTSTGQHVSEEQAVEPVALFFPNHQPSSFFSENFSPTETLSLHILSVLRL